MFLPRSIADIANRRGLTIHAHGRLCYFRSCYRNCSGRCRRSLGRRYTADHGQILDTAFAFIWQTCNETRVTHADSLLLALFHSHSVSGTRAADHSATFSTMVSAVHHSKFSFAHHARLGDEVFHPRCCTFISAGLDGVLMNRLDQRSSGRCHGSNVCSVRDGLPLSAGWRV